MKWSVVVASVHSSDLLAESLEALAPQCARIGAELIVARPADAPGSVSEHGFRLVSAPAGSSLPMLRAAGLRAADGEWVGLTEDNCVPREGWLAQLVAAADDHVDVVGGIVAGARRGRAIDRGACFAEYGAYGPLRAPLPAGKTPAVTCASVAYRRDAARSVADWSADGAWDDVVHERLCRAGSRFRTVSTAIVDENLRHEIAAFSKQRFRHGREYAARRVGQFGPVRRMAYVLGAPLLPALLAWRIWQSAGRAAPNRFARALPFTLTFLAAWAAGEAVGYLAGERG